MSTDQRNPQAVQQCTANDDAAFAARRRLLRGGLAAAPVLMTVASRPVMAQDCVASSAHASLSGSTQAKVQSCTQGGAPAYWIAQNGPTESASGYLMQTKSGKGGGAGAGKAKTFGSVFGGAYGYGDLTLLQVMQAGQSSFDKSGLAAYLVAAVLNAEAGYTPASVLSVATAQDIWSDYNMMGYFEPTAGVRWDSARIIDWLKTTMPVTA